MHMDILKAVNLDAEAAVSGLEVGDEFIGAFGEASKAGYERGTLAYNLFVTLYLDYLERRAVKVHVTEVGIVKELRI